MNDLFALGIPTLNRADLLNETLAKYVVDFPDTWIYVVDNGGQKIFTHDHIIMIRPLTNMGVAASWNRMSEATFEKKIPNVMILNDDVYSGKKQTDITDYLKQNEDKDFICTHQDWCIFILPEKTFLKVGGFDEKFFPAYFEDNDYAYRMKLLGLNQTATTFLSPFIFRKSMTLKKDFSTNKDFDKNKNYYIEKWGGLPEHEKFDKPFNK